MRPIHEIIVHCTATPEGRGVTVAEINSWHKARGWSGIGYHRVIGLNGERWDGRPIAQIGAHCEGRNTGTIGVVYVGGLAKDAKTPKDTRTAAQKSALVAELISLRDQFAIKKISGHNDYAAKACPCFNATAEFAGLTDAKIRGIYASTTDEVLQRGDSGSAVVEWRQKLTALRKLIGHPYNAGNGETFDHTLEMVTLWFQEKRGIVRDGKVGPQTQREMELALAGKQPFEALAA